MDLSALLPNQFASELPIRVWLPLVAPAILLTVRFAGLVYTAPLLASPVVPHRLRLGLAMVLGLCCGITPATAGAPSVGSLLDLASLLPMEFVVGAALGFSARLLLAGLELAAGLIDSQTGTTTATLFQPDLGSETSPTGQWFALLAGLTWLTLAPVGGDLRIMAALLETVRTLPPGTLLDPAAPTELVHDVMLAALTLGLQVAAPLIVAVGLLNSLCAALARARGGGAWTPALHPLRVLVALLVLTSTSTAIGERVAGGIDGLLRNSVQLLAPSAAENRP